MVAVAPSKTVAGPSTEAFYMDVYEVTNAQYGKFIKAKEYSEPEY